MIDLSPPLLEVLVKISIGQHIRDYGILQSDIRENDQVAILLSKELIFQNHWTRNLKQYKTTERGSEIAQAIANRIIEEKKEYLRTTVDEVPRRALGFFIKRYISKSLNFNTSKPFIPPYPNSWEDIILSDSRIWILWDRFFNALESCRLCVSTHYYVGTRGGETRDIRYVISPEIRSFLVSFFPYTDFASDQENSIILYPVLKKMESILANEDLDSVRQQCYQLLKDASVSEKQLAGIVDDMSKIGITSDYRGLLSEMKLFEIFDASRFQVYLGKNLLEPAVDILLQEKGNIRTFSTKKEIENYEDALGRFYFTVSSFERQLRDFIKTKLGEGWNKRIEKDLLGVAEEWRKREKNDIDIGVEPEKELINYADLDHYVKIIEKYDRLFTDGKEELERVKVKLRDWGSYGRNPIMHSRTVDQQKIVTTESSIKYLQAWMHRKTLFEA